MELFFWLLFSAGVGYFAYSKGRNAFGWGVLALIISPLIAAIIVAAIKDLNTLKQIDNIDYKTNNLRTEMDYNQKFNDYRAQHMSNDIKALNSNVSQRRNLESSKNNLMLENKVKCLFCGKMVSADAKFCDKCGTKINKMRTCENCNEEFDLNSNFCPHCGFKVQKDVVCPNCGKMYDNEVKYCSDCGTEL